MSITAAYRYDGEDQPPPISVKGVPLQDGFGAAAINWVSHENFKATPAEIGEAQNAAVNDDGTTEELILDPYAQTLKQRVFNKIENGLWGEALDTISQSLDGASADYVQEILIDLKNECTERGFNDFSNQLSGLLSHSDLGLDVEFFNTGENSSGDVDEPDVKINRHAIQAHFDRERLKPEMHVRPFMGTPYG